MVKIVGFITGILTFFSSLFGATHTGQVAVPTNSPVEPTVAPLVIATTSATTTPVVATSPTKNTVVTQTTTSATVDLTKLASDKYASGEVPLGDYHYVTDAPKKGYVYLCHVMQGNGGSNVNGPWIHGNTWNYKEKIAVSGQLAWPSASFSDIVSGVSRVLTTNALPINHTTGIFPVSTSDAAYQYDKNPNSIGAQNIKVTLPENPVYSNTPYCMGGEVGIMLSGVPLFNAFDAGLRDAPAHEEQDSCNGHPQGSEEYHYHSLSPCFKDISVTTILGYAYDGYPITGPQVSPGMYLTTDSLDECHGITSPVNENGKMVTTYHYVMTYDFPYSVSCFHAKPVTTGPSVQPTSGQTQGGNNNGMMYGQGYPPPPPPNY